MESTSSAVTHCSPSFCIDLHSPLTQRTQRLHVRYRLHGGLDADSTASSKCPVVRAQASRSPSQPLCVHLKDLGVPKRGRPHAALVNHRVLKARGCHECKILLKRLWGRLRQRRGAVRIGGQTQQGPSNDHPSNACSMCSSLLLLCAQALPCPSTASLWYRSVENMKWDLLGISFRVKKNCAIALAAGLGNDEGLHHIAP